MVSCESGQDKLGKLIWQAARALGIPDAEIPDLPITTKTRVLPLGTPEGHAWLIAEAARTGSKFVGIDPSNKVFEPHLARDQVSRGSASDMVGALQALTDPLTEQGIATLLVSHTTKGGARGSKEKALVLEDVCGAGYAEHHRNRYMLTKVKDFNYETRTHELLLAAQLSDGEGGGNFSIKIVEGEYGEHDWQHGQLVGYIEPVHDVAALFAASVDPKKLAAEQLELAATVEALMLNEEIIPRVNGGVTINAMYEYAKDKGMRIGAKKIELAAKELCKTKRGSIHVTNVDKTDYYCVAGHCGSRLPDVPVPTPGVQP